MNSVFLGKQSPTTESATQIVRMLLDSNPLTLDRAMLSKGWMAPNGDVVPVYGHGSWEYRGRTYRYGTDDISGWLRLVKSGGTLYIGASPNTVQLRELKNLAIENGWELVDDESRHIEL